MSYRCRGRGRWLRGSVAAFLGDHRLQVRLNLLALKDSEGALWRHVLLVLARGADNAYRGVVDRELLVLLERLPEGMQAVADELFEVACIQFVDAERMAQDWSVRAVSVCSTTYSP